jgi:hypothetical protein
MSWPTYVLVQVLNVELFHSRASGITILGAFRAYATSILASREYIGGNAALVPFTLNAVSSISIVYHLDILSHIHSIAACAIFSAASKYPLLQYSPASFVHSHILQFPSFSKSKTSPGFGSRSSRSIVMTSCVPRAISMDRSGATSIVNWVTNSRRSPVPELGTRERIAKLVQSA